MDALTLGFLMAFFAGLSTAIGAAIVFLLKELKPAYLAFSLAFSTGVMMTVSFLELMPESILIVGHAHSLVFFFTGSLIALIIDYFVPHEYIMECVSGDCKHDSRLLKTGVFVALGLAIHNFPEGFAVMAGSLQSLELGIVVAIAIAMHNIPEGIAVAMPVFFSTGKKRKAFLVSFLSGMAEPVGAILAAFVLLPFLSPLVIGGSLALVSGFMVYICVDELLPTTMHYAKQNTHLMTSGFLVGSIVMGATLVMLS